MLFLHGEILPILKLKRNILVSNDQPRRKWTSDKRTSVESDTT